MRYQELLNGNKRWVDEKLEIDPNYFKKLASGQNPPFLFVGCSDSRKPLDTILKTEPGELFIHRNIANQISLTDMNFMSILEYSVFKLKVQHIIVCGHYHCGGVNAAIDGVNDGLVENWVAPIRDLYNRNRAELDTIANKDAKADRLSEINVEAQVKNIFRTSAMHKAIASGIYPRVHGWIFDIYTGLIKEVPLPLDEWKDMGLIPLDY